MEMQGYDHELFMFQTKKLEKLTVCFFYFLFFAL